ncbi:hypothetical protein CPC08DRAFT_314952 [Agrocybe pediades]|nr:hypothetical protein CPC08DRAFT_314952 [Agrocybe pediades]
MPGSRPRKRYRALIMALIDSSACYSAMVIFEAILYSLDTGKLQSSFTIILIEQFVNPISELLAVSSFVSNYHSTIELYTDTGISTHAYGCYVNFFVRPRKHRSNLYPSSFRTHESCGSSCHERRHSPCLSTRH